MKTSILSCVWTVMLAGTVLGGETTRVGRRPEEFLPKDTMVLISLRDMSRTTQRLYKLGAWNIATKLDLRGKFWTLWTEFIEKPLGTALVPAGLTVEDLKRLFKGGAFAALIDIQDGTPRQPKAIVWVEVMRPEARAIETLTAFLAGLAGAQGLAVDGYDHLGCKISVVKLPVPGMPLEVAWSFVPDGFAFSLGREPLEEFLSRRLQPPEGENLASLPICKEIRKKLGGDEDLLAIWNVRQTLTKLGRDAEEGLTKVGLGRAALGYGLKITERGVKETFGIASTEHKGVLSLELPGLALPDRAAAAELAHSMFALDAALDAGQMFEWASGLAMALGGEDAARQLRLALSELAAAINKEPDELLRALSGKLSVRLRQRELGVLPDLTMVFDSQNTEVLAKLLQALVQRADFAEPKLFEFQGAKVTTLLPRGGAAPTHISPAFALGPHGLYGALSVQGLKRLLGEPKLAGGDALREGAIIPALRELSDAPCAFVAADLTRACGVAFDIASLVPGDFGRTFREITLSMPPVEELLSELGGAAIALYTRGGALTVECYSPTGVLPLAAGLRMKIWRVLTSPSLFMSFGRAVKPPPDDEPF